MPEAEQPRTPTEMGLAPAERLRQRAEFDAVFADARSIANDCFRLLGRPNRTDLSRLGMIVSRRVDRRAVVRNRIKRVIRESFRARKHQLAGWDLVVLAKGGAAAAESRALRGSMDKLWDRFKGRYAGIRS